MFGLQSRGPAALLAALLLSQRATAAISLPPPPASVEQWSVFELAQAGPDDAPPTFNAFTDVAASVSFTHVASAEVAVVAAFYDGNATYLARFSPPRLGAYTYSTSSSSALMPQVNGSFVATSPSADNRGPVLTDPANARALVYADGTPHFSVGTTAYAWAHRSAEDASATLAALRGAAFNKVRMALFPKFYPYTHEEPPGDFFAFARAAAQPAPNCSFCCSSRNGTFDLARFNPPFWRAIEGYVGSMRDMGVQADLILFHPYDGGHWGFDCMPLETDLFYLRYAAARLGAFRNVWWSMANEWSDLKCKCAGQNSSACPQTWFDALFRGLTAADPHRRRRSIHNGPIYYNHSQPWVDHVSMQCHGNGTAGGNSSAAGSACVDLAVASWAPKPIVLDEVRYEGTIASTWGRLTGEQMTQRFWLFLSKGAYAGHSETVLPAGVNASCAVSPSLCGCNAHMWWNKGQPFTGVSVTKVPFFRSYVEALPVPFSELVSETLLAGVFWLHDASYTFGLILWDESVLAAPTQALVPLPAGVKFGARQVDFFAEAFVDLDPATGPLAFTPPTPGFVLELRRALPALLAAPLAMDRVALAPGSRFAYQRSRNLVFLLSLNLTDVLCQYTSSANITGTFEAPTCVNADTQHYYGHFAGHFLSATAQLCNATSDAGACARNAEAVSTLAAVQQAWTATGLPEYVGYLFPSSFNAFANLIGPPSANCDPVCVPFYVLHKVLAGMIDSYLLAGSAQALDVALGMAAWVKRTAEAVLAMPDGANVWQQVLNVEWGGTNDALFNLANITGDGQWLTAASYFNHFNWTAPLAAGVDDLASNHANTHIPEVVGDARGFELTGNLTKLAIVDSFWHAQVDHHAFATGNGNYKEHWHTADAMGDELFSDTEESCTTYNLLKVSRHLWSWSLNSSFFDHYERALYNGLLGNQGTTGPYKDGETTAFTYMLPMGGFNLTKRFEPSNSSLPCCWGSLSETFAKLSDSIFWESADASTLFVNLFVPATASWRGGAVLRQDSGYPYASKATTAITVVAAGAAPTFTVSVRVPFWATGANSVPLNGSPRAAPAVPGSYLSVTRAWADGDILQVLFPQSLRFEQLNDARSNFTGVGAVLYGGIMLASANAATDVFPLDTSPEGLDKAFSRSQPPPTGDYSDLVFSAVSKNGTAATFLPLSDIVFENYATYIRTLE